jgi:hypothetical protein
MLFDVIRELHGGDALGRLVLARHGGHLAAARRTRALIRRELVTDLDVGQRGLRPRTVARSYRARDAGGGWVRLAREGLRPGVLELLPERKFELFRIGHAA